MQLHSRGCGCAEDVLKGRQFGFILRRQLWFLLLEDRQRKDISETHNSHTFIYKDSVEYSALNLDLIVCSEIMEMISGGALSYDS